MQYISASTLYQGQTTLLHSIHGFQDLKSVFLLSFQLFIPGHMIVAGYGFALDVHVSVLSSVVRTSVCLYFMFG